MISPRHQAQAGLVAAAAVFLSASWILLAGAIEKPNLYAGQPGSPAASLRLPDLDGRNVSLSSMRGSVVLLCFASLSEGQLPYSEIKRLAELGEQYSANEDVRIVAVCSGTEDLPREQMSSIRSLAAEAGPRCTMLLDPTSYAARRFFVDQSTTFFVIDPAGMIRYRGGLDDASPDAPIAAASFSSTIDLLLAEKPLPGAAAPAVLSNIK